MATWTPLNIPNYYTMFYDICPNYDGTTLVATCNNDRSYDGFKVLKGIYTSTDSGVTWTRTDTADNFDDIYGSSICCDPSGIYFYVICHNYHYIYVSADSGQTWNSNDTNGLHNFKFICATNDGVVYVAGPGPNCQNVYKSVDYGATFIVDGGPPTRPNGWDGLCMTPDGTKVFAVSGGDNDGTPSVMYISTDSGATWNINNNAPNGNYISWGNSFVNSGIVCNADGSIITAIYYGFNDGIFHVTQSTDGGATWGDIFVRPSSYGALVGLSSDLSGNFALLGRINSPLMDDVFHSSNLSTALPILDSSSSIYPNNFRLLQNGNIYVPGSNKTYKLSTLSSPSWTQLYIPVNTWTSMTSNSSGSRLALVNDLEKISSGIYVSSNGGTSWSELTTDFTDTWMSVRTNQSGNVIVAGGNDSYYLVTSFDYGSTWTMGDIYLPWSGVCTNSDGSILYACANYGNLIYKCVDSSGSQWLSTNSPSGDWSSIACDSTGNLVIACSYGDAVYYSSDGGDNWSALTVDPNPGLNAWRSVSSSYNGRILMACSTDNMSYGYCYVSTDFGSTWTDTGLDAALDSTAVSGNGNFLLCTAEAEGPDAGIYSATSTNPSNWSISSTFRDFWSSITLNNDGTTALACVYGGQVYKYETPPLVCFKKGTKILTHDGYVPIEKLKKGDLVKTHTAGYVPIFEIGVKTINHLACETRIKDQLYVCSPENYDVGEDLVITGCHAILVDEYPGNTREESSDLLGKVFVTEGKYRLPACLDERAQVYPVKGEYNIYHIALEHTDYYMNYGILANGLLVESCSKRYLKELSGMKLI